MKIELNNSQTDLRLHLQIFIAVSESELKRIKEAFKRVDVNGFITKSSFVKEVLGEGVPRNVADVC